MPADNPFSPPDIFTARRVLAVQPHYDDNDIAAGGTLAALADQGAELFYLTVTDDKAGVIDPSIGEDAMTARLRREQRQAGAHIGVSGHYWLDFPDAGRYDYFDVRRGIIRHIRMLRPDFIVTVDPWMPYEAHNDHILTGRAAAEAAIPFGLDRLPTDPEVDAAYEAHELIGIAFYGTAYPNRVIDISRTRLKKHAAISCYRAQFSEQDMEMLHRVVDMKEQEFAREKDFSHGEPLKLLRGFHLHGYPQAVST